MLHNRASKCGQIRASNLSSLHRTRGLELPCCVANTVSMLICSAEVFSRLTCETRPPWARTRPRSKGHGPERCSTLPRALRDPVRRPRPSVQSPKEEVTRRANGRRRKSAHKRVSHNTFWQEAIQRGLRLSSGNFLWPGWRVTPGGSLREEVG